MRNLPNDSLLVNSFDLCDVDVPAASKYCTPPPVDQAIKRTTIKHNKHGKNGGIYCELKILRNTGKERAERERKLSVSGM